MSKINICLDTDESTMEMTRDGKAIEHDEFALGSYFLNEPMDGGTPSSYFPSQYSYFTYSKKMEDGSKACTYGNFKVGAKGSYKEKAATYNIAKACADNMIRAIASDKLGDYLTREIGKKPFIKQDREKPIGVPKIDPENGDISTQPNSGPNKLI